MTKGRPAQEDIAVMRAVTPAEQEELIAALRGALAVRPEIRSAYPHGSFLQGRFYRDVDLALLLDPARIPAAHWRAYETDLSVELQVRLHQPIDGRVLNDASLAFRYHALQGRRLLARDADEDAEFRARTWDAYFDFLPFARAYLREALGV